MQKLKIFLVFIFVLVNLLTACATPTPTESLTNDEISFSITEIGQPYVSNEIEVHRQNNCDGSDRGLTISRNLSQEQTMTFSLVGGGNGGAEWAIIPEILKAQIEANINSAVEYSGGQDYERGVEFTLAAEPGYIVEHTITWKETHVSGLLDVMFPEGIEGFSFVKIVGVELENRSSEKFACPGSTTIQDTSNGYDCLFVDVLISNSDIIKKLDVPTDSGFYGGVQARLIKAVDVPVGWIVYKDEMEYAGPVHLDAGVVASFWSPESCRPLNLGTSQSPSVVDSTPIQSSSNSLCPTVISRELIEEWGQIGETTQDTTKTYIDEFDRMRVGGEFEPQDVLPVGVVIITDFGDGESPIYQQYPVRPIVHYGSWGVFETIGEYIAVQSGACMSIAP